MLKSIFYGLVMLALVIAPVAGAETPPAPVIQASEAVRVNGLDFQVLSPVVWAVPSSKMPTTITLSLKVTNRTDKALSVLDIFGIVLKNATGEVMPVLALPTSGLSFPSSQLVEKGGSRALDCSAELKFLADKPHTFRLDGRWPDGSPWHIDGLKAGRYTISMIYAHDPNDAPLWVGKATTKELAVEITDKMPVTSKPVEKDGLRVTVTLPKAAFAADEPIQFTVQFKDVSERPFQLLNADYFGCWKILFEDVRAGGTWRLSQIMQAGKRKPTIMLVESGKTRAVPVVLEAQLPEAFHYTWEGAVDREPRPRDHLNPGKYRLTIEFDQQADSNDPAPAVSYWTGKLRTEPVEFEITDKAAATKP